MKFPFRPDKPVTPDSHTQPTGGNNGARCGHDPRAADPAAVTPLVLSIDRIKLYDRNPRREPNPRYADIKASVRAQGGLNNPLIVTRRPGDEHYMVDSGGNTRLEVLVALHEETQDPRFRQVHCLFRSWVAESRVLSAHLVENELRGQMVFIDKALALQDLKVLFERETEETLSRNGFLRRLHELGFPISKRQSIRFDYAAEILYPRIPLALSAGLGSRDIDRIRKLEGAYRSYWDSNKTLAALESDFDRLFCDALASSDGSDFDLELLRQALEARLATTLDVAVADIRLNVDAVLLDVSQGGENDNDLSAEATDGSTFSFDPAEFLEASPSGPHGTPSFADWRGTSVGKSAEAERTASLDTPSPTREQDTHCAQEPGSHGQRRGDQQSELEPQSETQSTSSEISLESAEFSSSDLSSLRQRNHELASNLARRHHLEDCLLPHSNLGMGFLLELPTEPLPRGAETQPLQQWLWWLLLSLSEATVQSERLARLGSDHRLGSLILENRTEEIFAVVGEPDWRALGFQVLNDPAFDDEDLQDLFLLVVNCRQLRKLSHDAGDLTLWQEETGE